MACGSLREFIQEAEKSGATVELYVGGSYAVPFGVIGEDRGDAVYLALADEADNGSGSEIWVDSQVWGWRKR